MRSHASLGFTAVATSIALFFLLLCTTMLFYAAVNDQPEPLSGIVSMIVIGLVAGVVCVAGIYDHLQGIRLPELDRWIDWLDSRKLRWKDCYASGDPVPNGVVTAAAKDRSMEVCNRSSMVSDHTTYWSNLDEFVSVLFEEIGASRKKDPVPDLRLGTALVERIARRRRWRVALGRCIEWVGAVGVFAVLVHRWPAFEAFLMWAWSRTGASIVEPVLGVQSANSPDYSIDWITVGLLVLILGASLVVRSLWYAGDQTDMKRSLGLRVRGIFGDVAVIFVPLWFLVMIATHVVRYTSEVSLWLTVLSFVPVMVFIALTPDLHDRPRKGSPERVPSTAGSNDTLVGTLGSTAIGLGMAAALPFSLGLAGWDALIWLTERVSPSRQTLFGFRLGNIPSEAVGGVAVLVFAVAWTIVSMRRKPQPAKPAAAGR